MGMPGLSCRIIWPTSAQARSADAENYGVSEVVGSSCTVAFRLSGGLRRTLGRHACRRADHEVDAFEAFEREALGGTFGHVEQELRPVPAFVLVLVDVERRTADFAEQPVVRPGGELACGEADRGAAVTAAPRLHEHQWAVLRRQLLDRANSFRSRRHPLPIRTAPAVAGRS